MRLRRAPWRKYPQETLACSHHAALRWKNLAPPNSFGPILTRPKKRGPRHSQVGPKQQANRPRHFWVHSPSVIHYFPSTPTRPHPMAQIPSARDRLHNEARKIAQIQVERERPPATWPVRWVPPSFSPSAPQEASPLPAFCERREWFRPPQNPFPRRREP